MNNMATVQEIDANISSWHSGGTKDRVLTEKDLNEIFHFLKLKTVISLILVDCLM